MWYLRGSDCSQVIYSSQNRPQEYLEIWKRIRCPKRQNSQCLAPPNSKAVAFKMKYTVLDRPRGVFPHSFLCHYEIKQLSPSVWHFVHNMPYSAKPSSGLIFLLASEIAVPLSCLLLFSATFPVLVTPASTLAYGKESSVSVRPVSTPVFGAGSNEWMVTWGWFSKAGGWLGIEHLRKQYGPNEGAQDPLTGVRGEFSRD